MSEAFLKHMKTIPAGKRQIVKGSDRFFIYLPQNLNHIWEKLNKMGIKVEVYLVIPDQKSEN